MNVNEKLLQSHNYTIEKTSAYVRRTSHNSFNVYTAKIQFYINRTCPKKDFNSVNWQIASQKNRNQPSELNLVEHSHRREIIAIYELVNNVLASFLLIKVAFLVWFLLKNSMVRDETNQSFL